MQTPDEWCVYTGRWYRSDQMNSDHVIPLSLGGHDRFTVRVSSHGNTEANRLFDQPIGRHPFVAFMRRTHSIGGRRNESANVPWPTKVGDAPGIVDWSKSRVELATFRSKAPYAINMRRTFKRGESFSSEGTFDSNLLTRFGCRLALGAAQYLFGDLFREFGYHEKLRDLMAAPNANELLDFNNLNTVGDSPFWGIAWPNLPGEGAPLWGELTRQAKGHLVFTHHTPEGIILGIVLFEGFFHWYFNISKDPSRFPSDGSFALGSITQIHFDPLTFHRTDLRSHLEPVFRELLVEKPK